MDGAVTWQYVGQARYSNSPEPVTSQWIEAASGLRQVGGIEPLQRATRTYANGSEWEVMEVDSDELAARIESYDEAAGVHEEDGLTLDEALDGEWIDVDSEGYEWTPNGWTHPTCSSPSITYNILDTDTREQQTSLTARQETAVLILVDLAGGLQSVCSGVLLDEDTVLTAAHCVSDGSGDERPTADVSVCTLGNAYTGADCDTAAASITLDPDYIPGLANWDPTDDVAGG